MAVPFGWILFREDWSPSVYLMPLWLWIPFVLRYQPWLVLRWLTNRGLWHVEEGDYYVNGHLRCPAWLHCFLTDRDSLPCR